MIRTAVIAICATASLAIFGATANAQFPRPVQMPYPVQRVPQYPVQPQYPIQQYPVQPQYPQQQFPQQPQYPVQPFPGQQFPQQPPVPGHDDDDCWVFQVWTKAPRCGCWELTATYHSEAKAQRVADSLDDNGYCVKVRRVRH